MPLLNLLNIPKVLPILGTVVALMVVSQFMVIKSMGKDLDLANATIEAQLTDLQSLKSSAAMADSLRADDVENLKEIHQSLAESEKENNQLRSILHHRRIEAIADRKPGLLQKRVNLASAAVATKIMEAANAP